MVFTKIMQSKENQEMSNEILEYGVILYKIVAKVYQYIYNHVNKTTTIDLSNTVLKTCNNTKFFFGIKNKVRSNFYPY